MNRATDPRSVVPSDGMTSANRLRWNVASEESQIWFLAAECIARIDAYGFVGTSRHDAVRRVAEAMLDAATRADGHGE